MRVTRPTSEILSVPNNEKRAASPRELRIERKDDTAETAWEFRPSGERFELLAGTRKLEELREAIRGIPGGRGDFAVGPDEGAWDDRCLSVWWMPRPIVAG